MTASTTPTRATHDAFLRILPAIQAHARAAFRHLCRPDDRDDAVAEVVAYAWEQFRAAPVPAAPDHLAMVATAAVRATLAPTAC